MSLKNDSNEEKESLNQKSPWSFATSPRSPNVVIERFVLLKKFDNSLYDKDLQKKIGEHIRLNSEKTVGLKSHNSKADFVGRDFITRTPKKLGLVFLPKAGKGNLLFTEQGNNLIKSKYPSFVMQRQIAKWQYPSPNAAKGTGHLKLIPLTSVIYILKKVKSLSRSELASFVITLEDYNNINDTVKKILEFRNKIQSVKGNLKRRKFRKEEFLKQIKNYYKDSSVKKLRERKGKKVNENDFYNVRMRNHKDYADAAFRYFLSTGLFKMNKQSRIEISDLNKLDADFLLEKIGLKPKDIKESNQDYVINFLGKEKSVEIYSDDENNLKNKILYLKKNADSISLNTSDFEKKFLSLKSLDEKNGLLIDFEEAINIKKMQKYIEKLAQRKIEDYQDILEVFKNINDRDYEILDRPLLYEWNFFRCFAFIGKFKEIIPSLKFDEDTNPLHTSSSVPDLIIEYDNFTLVNEVTLTTGARQYEVEGAPVFRHVGQYQKNNPDKKVFGLFVADKLDPNMPIEFLSRSFVNTDLYNGRVKILPMDRNQFVSLFTKIYEEKLDENFILNILEELLSDSALEVFKNTGENSWVEKLNLLIK